TNQLHWTAPQENAHILAERTLGDENEQRSLLEELRRRRELTVRRAPKAWTGGRRTLLVFVPILAGDKPEEGILALFNVQQMLDAVLNANVVSGFAIAIFDKGEQIYNRHGVERDYEQQWGQTNKVTLFGMDWQVRIWPTPQIMAKERFPLPKVALFVGFS